MNVYLMEKTNITHPLPQTAWERGKSLSKEGIQLGKSTEKLERFSEGAMGQLEQLSSNPQGNPACFDRGLVKSSQDDLVSLL